MISDERYEILLSGALDGGIEVFSDEPFWHGPACESAYESDELAVAKLAHLCGYFPSTVLNNVELLPTLRTNILFYVVHSRPSYLRFLLYDSSNVLNGISHSRLIDSFSSWSTTNLPVPSNARTWHMTSNFFPFIGLPQSDGNCCLL